MKKILIVDVEPLNLPFCISCAEAGYDVYWFSNEDTTNPTGPKDVGKGIPGITIVKNWVSVIKKMDLTVLMDNGQFVERLDAFKRMGLPIFSPSVKSTELEVKREVGLKFLQDHGIDVPPYHKFNTLDEAVAFLKTDKGRYVFKTLGDEEDKSMSYCSKDAGDMIEHINWLKKNKLAPKDPFILQKFIKGIEFAVNTWVGSKGFLGKFCEGFEHKGLAAGEVGPATGEMGTVCKYVSSSNYGEEILRPLEEDLVKMGHLGNIDVNCIIDEDGKAWPLEFTSRFGYPAWQMNQKQHLGDPIQWMIDAINGKDTLQVKMDIALCVVLVVPPFPFEDDAKAYKKSQDLPIYGITGDGVKTGNRRYLSPQFVKMGEYTVLDDKGNFKKVKDWVTAGTYYMVVTALGDSIEQCRKRVYNTIDDLHTPGEFYRNDIGVKVLKWLPDLHKHGLGEEFK